MTVERVALFVEGSIEGRAANRRDDPLISIWNNLLCEAVGIPHFDVVLPMSKKHLVAMDPSNPKMSGAGEPFDEYLARQLKTHEFDAAVVAWDLVPRWNPNDEFCRWQETLDFYGFVGQSESEALPENWKTQARNRHATLLKSHSTKPPQLKRGMLLALCMEPMFEVLLTHDEAALRRAFGCSETPRNWPRHGWADPHPSNPDRSILHPAIDAIQAVRPKLKCANQVRGDFTTNKNGWGEFLLRKLLGDERAKSQVLATPFVTRLSQIRR